MNKNKFKGFTLAETLITLVIIGIVAALTIPAFIQNYQEQDLKNRFKKSYSTIENAIYSTYASTGLHDCYITEGSYFTSECSKFYTELSKKLQIIKKCDTKSFENGCIPDYKLYVNEKTASCSGFSITNIKDNNPAWILSDGSIILSYLSFSRPTFAIDINGKAKPNKWGKDMFPLYITLHQSNSLYVYYKPLSAFGDCVNLVSKGGRTTEEMFKYVYK